MTLWRRAPLWFRLVASLVGLAALALIVSGLVGARLLRGYLVDRVDAQLESAAATLAAGPISQQEAEAQLPSPFHVNFYYPDGQVAGVWWSPLEDRSTSPTAPETLTPDQARRRAGEPFTIDDVVHDGSWRAVALPIDGPQGAIGSVLVATNMHEVDATVDRLQHIAMLVGLAVLAGLALAGYWIVRTALRPLTRIEQTAAAITRGDLTRRVPDADPATEVGRVGRGLNTMLDQIEGAFEAREASEATALRSEARMRQFVADASHELRTPLTSIRGFAELYRQPTMTDRAAVADALRRIEDEAKRMGLLVDDLLLLARLDQQRPFATDPVDLVAVARDATDAARVVSSDRSISFTAPTDGVTVSGDDSRLRHLVTNLVDNALRHTPAGTPVEVGVGAVERDARGWAELTVVDHGNGLTPEQAGRVFERFYRTDAARSRKGPSGAGLGLSIVRAIALAHGGTAEVDSGPGQGATFRVLLPLLEPESPVEPPPNRPSTEADTPAPPATASI
ncbi:MAG TPA: HAMP domain-containing sensor histidine kinase [Acidimicrobiales bacterium]|nr:HAMP domain-containing sensor histidine kinase [Acidimicrobiales bacterium]